MANRFWLGVLVLIISVSSTRAQQSAELRGKVKAWMDDNFSDVVPEVAVQIAATADSAMQGGADVAIHCDGDMLRGRKTTTAFTYAGQFFTAPLSHSQQTALGLYAGKVQVADYPTSDKSKRLAQPIFEVSNVTIENADRIDGNKIITGSFNFKSISDTPYKSVIVRLATRTSSTRRTNTIITLPADNVIKFEIERINAADRDPYFGAAPVFVDLLVTGIEENAAVASNTVATMIDVLPDHDAFGRWAVATTGKFVNILASVKDQASADKAFDAYMRLAADSKSVQAQMEHLGPAPAEVDKKYEAEAEKFAQKLQAELTRLEGTDYGRAFLDRTAKGAGDAAK